MALANSLSDDGGPAVAVTVVVATRNRALQALNTVKRLAALPDGPAVMAVVDGSTDHTERIIREHAPTVEVLAWPDRRGAAAARNAGVAAATTPYVAFSDDDSWWAPGALAVIEYCFDAYPNLALVAGRILVGEEERLDPTCLAMADSPLSSEGLPGPRVLGFVACGAAVRRQAFLDVGGFPERYVIGGEEEPLALELASAGWDLAYVAEALAFHRPSSSARDNSERDRRVVRNDLWTAWRHRSPGGALRRTVSIAAHADTAAKRAGILEAVIGLPGILRHRRPVGSEVEAQRRRLPDQGDSGPVWWR